MTVAAPDYAHTGEAERNRAVKARTLAAWLWDNGLTFADLPSATDSELRAYARAADVTPPHGRDTWEQAAVLLAQRAAWSAEHPDDPRAARPAAADRDRWAPAALLAPPAAAPAPEPADPGITGPTAAAQAAMAATRAWLTARPPLPTVPRGWDALAALPPLARIDARCMVCRRPAVVGTPPGWRCAEHPPQPGEWGHALDWTPTPTRCAPTRCYCGRCPAYRTGTTHSPIADSALLEERAIASGKRRANPEAFKAARDAEAARKEARR